MLLLVVDWSAANHEIVLCVDTYLCLARTLPIFRDIIIVLINSESWAQSQLGVQWSGLQLIKSEE